MQLASAALAPQLVAESAVVVTGAPNTSVLTAMLAVLGGSPSNETAASAAAQLVCHAALAAAHAANATAWLLSVSVTSWDSFHAAAAAAAAGSAVLDTPANTSLGSLRLLLSSEQCRNAPAAVAVAAAVRNASQSSRELPTGGESSAAAVAPLLPRASLAADAARVTSALPLASSAILVAHVVVPSGAPLHLLCSSGSSSSAWGVQRFAVSTVTATRFNGLLLGGQTPALEVPQQLLPSVAEASFPQLNALIRAGSALVCNTSMADGFGAPVLTAPASAPMMCAALRDAADAFFAGNAGAGTGRRRLSSSRHLQISNSSWQPGVGMVLGTFGFIALAATPASVIPLPVSSLAPEVVALIEAQAEAAAAAAATAAAAAEAAIRRSTVLGSCAAALVLLIAVAAAVRVWRRRRAATRLQQFTRARLASLARVHAAERVVLRAAAAAANADILRAPDGPLPPSQPTQFAQPAAALDAIANVLFSDAMPVTHVLRSLALEQGDDATADAISEAAAAAHSSIGSDHKRGARDRSHSSSSSSSRSVTEHPMASPSARASRAQAVAPAIVATLRHAARLTLDHHDAHWQTLPTPSSTSAGGPMRDGSEPLPSGHPISTVSDDAAVISSGGDASPPPVQLLDFAAAASIPVPPLQASRPARHADKGSAPATDVSGQPRGRQSAAAAAVARLVQALPEAALAAAASTTLEAAAAAIASPAALSAAMTAMTARRVPSNVKLVGAKPVASRSRHGAGSSASASASASASQSVLASTPLSSSRQPPRTVEETSSIRISQERLGEHDDEDDDDDDDLVINPFEAIVEVCVDELEDLLLGPEPISGHDESAIDRNGAGAPGSGSAASSSTALGRRRTRSGDSRARRHGGSSSGSLLSLADREALLLASADCAGFAASWARQGTRRSNPQNQDHLAPAVVASDALTVAALPQHVQIAVAAAASAEAEAAAVVAPGALASRGVPRGEADESEPASIICVTEMGDSGVTAEAASTASGSSLAAPPSGLQRAALGSSRRAAGSAVASLSVRLADARRTAVSANTTAAAAAARSEITQQTPLTLSLLAAKRQELTPLQLQRQALQALVICVLEASAATAGQAAVSALSEFDAQTAVLSRLAGDAVAAAAAAAAGSQTEAASFGSTGAKLSKSAPAAATAPSLPQFTPSDAQIAAAIASVDVGALTRVIRNWSCDSAWRLFCCFPWFCNKAGRRHGISGASTGTRAGNGGRPPAAANAEADLSSVKLHRDRVLAMMQAVAGGAAPSAALRLPPVPHAAADVRELQAAALAACGIVQSPAPSTAATGAGTGPAKPRTQPGKRRSIAQRMLGRSGAPRSQGVGEIVVVAAEGKAAAGTPAGSHAASRKKSAISALGTRHGAAKAAAMASQALVQNPGGLGIELTGRNHLASQHAGTHNTPAPVGPAGTAAAQQLATSLLFASFTAHSPSRNTGAVHADSSTKHATTPASRRRHVGDDRDGHHLGRPGGDDSEAAIETPTRLSQHGAPLSSAARLSSLLASLPQAYQRAAADAVLSPQAAAALLVPGALSASAKADIRSRTRGRSGFSDSEPDAVSFAPVSVSFRTASSSGSYGGGSSRRAGAADAAMRTTLRFEVCAGDDPAAAVSVDALNPLHFKRPLAR